MLAQKPGASVMPPLSPRHAAGTGAPACAAIAAPEIPPMTVAARSELSTRDSGSERVMLFSETLFAALRRKNEFLAGNVGGEHEAALGDRKYRHATLVVAVGCRIA